MIQKRRAGFFSVIAFLFVFAGLLSSCHTTQKINTDYVYFTKGMDTVSSSQEETILRPGDQLSIQVFSRSQNQEQAAIFNVQANGTGKQPYLITNDGNISMAVIGNVKAAGLTKIELEKVLVAKLTDYVKNPSLLISLLEFKVNVLGEVRTPGIQRFNTERVTVIDALSAAGDLTDYGKREDVLVIREDHGTKVHYNIDLRNTDLFNAPGYILQPNDIVYVSPNNSKLKSLNTDPEKQRRTSLIFGIVGIALSVATLIITSLK